MLQLSISSELNIRCIKGISLSAEGSALQVYLLQVYLLQVCLSSVLPLISVMCDCITRQ